MDDFFDTICTRLQRGIRGALHRRVHALAWNFSHRICDSVLLAGKTVLRGRRTWASTRMRQRGRLVRARSLRRKSGRKMSRCCPSVIVRPCILQHGCGSCVSERLQLAVDGARECGRRRQLQQCNHEHGVRDLSRGPGGVRLRQGPIDLHDSTSRRRGFYALRLRYRRKWQHSAWRVPRQRRSDESVLLRSLKGTPLPALQQHLRQSICSRPSLPIQ
jgi:hypothetical protein